MCASWKRAGSVGLYVYKKIRCVLFHQAGTCRYAAVKPCVLPACCDNIENNAGRGWTWHCHSCSSMIIHESHPPHLVVAAGELVSLWQDDWFTCVVWGLSVRVAASDVTLSTWYISCRVTGVARIKDTEPPIMQVWVTWVSKDSLSTVACTFFCGTCGYRFLLPWVFGDKSDLVRVLGEGEATEQLEPTP